MIGIRTSAVAVAVVALLGCDAAPWRVLAMSSAETGAPLPGEGVAFAASEDARLRAAWLDRNLVDAYRRVGRRNPRWDTRAESLLREGHELVGSENRGLSPNLDLLARSRELVQAGCDDPAVLYLAARAMVLADHNSREASETLERAVAGMHAVAYPRALARLVASGLRYDFERRKEGTGKRDALAPVELRWFMESVTDGSYGPDDDVVLVQDLTSNNGSWFFARNRAAVVSALERAAWVDPWVRLLFRGEQRLDDAWESRGSQFASEVTPEGWQGMSESLRGAREAFTESWGLRPDRPEAATGMIHVALAGGGGDTPRTWFDRAVAARFDYLPAYDSLKNSLRRRWGAPPGALLAFARECAATRRFDTDVPYMAFEAVEQLESDEEFEAREDEEVALPAHRRPPSPYRDESTFRMIATVMERYRRQSSRQYEWQRPTSIHAAVAYKAGRYGVARDLLRELNGVLTHHAHRAVEEPMLESRIEAYAASAELPRAEGLFVDGLVAEAVPLFEAARATSPPAGHAYLDHRLAAARAERDLAKGEPVSIGPAPGLAGWRVEVGSWEVEKDGALLGRSSFQGHLIAFDARVGPDFELSADVEIASTSNGQFQAGLLFGRSLTFWSQDWSSFRIKNTAHEGEVAHFARHFTRPHHNVQRPIPRRCRVVVQSWQGRLWAWIDGEAVVSDYRPAWEMPRTPDVGVGFGAYIDDNTYSVRYRDVVLRRLTSMPGPPSRVAAP
jgi:hypothetical protein